MKKFIFVLSATLSLASNCYANWTEKNFDLSKTTMTIRGDVRYSVKGLDLSQTTVTIYRPTVSAKHTGTPYNVGIAVDSGLDDLFCQKLGYKIGSYESEPSGVYDAIATLNSDLTVNSVYNPSSGRHFYKLIQCRN